jgi:hypothetical protein
MNLKKPPAIAAIAGVLAFGAIAVGAGHAQANPFPYDPGPHVPGPGPNVPGPGPNIPGPGQPGRGALPPGQVSPLPPGQVGQLPFVPPPGHWSKPLK